MRACRLDALPDRRTFDRRFKTIPVQDAIEMMGEKFVTERLDDDTIVSVDSSMIHARNGYIGHRRQMIQGNDSKVWH
jgi:hypothetical protein